MNRKLSATLALAGMLASSIAAAQPGSTPVTEAPPNGPGLGPQRPTPAINPIQLSPQDKEQLKDVESEYERFTQRADRTGDRARPIRSVDRLPDFRRSVSADRRPGR